MDIKDNLQVLNKKVHYIQMWSVFEQCPYELQATENPRLGKSVTQDLGGENKYGTVNIR